MIGAVVLAAGIAFAGDEDPGGRRVLICPPAPREIAVDGLLDDWEGVDRYRVTSADPPDGKDLSAQVALCYSEDRLFLCGEVLDDNFLTDVATRWEADAVEVFLDLDLADRDETAFNEDDFQIFLMPLNTVRRVDTYQAPGNRTFGFDLPGVAVAANIHADRGAYEFEASIPFAVLGLDPRETRAIGFDIAINDQDQADHFAGRPPAERFYLTLSGNQGLAVDTSRLCELRFEGPPAHFAQISQETRRRKLWQGLVSALSVLLALGLLGVGARWVHERVLLQRPWWRFAALATLALLCFLLWGGPRFLWARTRSGAERDLRERADLLAERLAQLGQEEEIALRLREADPEDLRNLFQGSALRGKGVTRHQVRDVLAERPAPGAYRSLMETGPSGPDIWFLEYGIPIGRGEGEDADSPLILELAQPEVATEIHLSVAAFLPGEDSHQEEDALLLTYEFEGDSASAAFTIDDCRGEGYGHDSPDWGLAARVMERDRSEYLATQLDERPMVHLDHFVHRIFSPVGAGISRIVLAPSEQARRRGVELWLSGISLVRGVAAPRCVPLSLGERDPDGFPTVVRDGCLSPTDLHLRPGDQHEVSLRGADGAPAEVNRLRLYYRTRDRRASAEVESNAVRAEVRVFMQGRADPVIIPLQEGFQIAPELFARDAAVLPVGFTSFIVSTFPRTSGLEYGLLHYDGYELELTGDESGAGPFAVERVVVSNPADSGADFYLAGLTSARAVDPEALPEHPLLVGGGSGEVALSDQILELLQGEQLGFGLVQDGSVAALGAGFAPEVEERLRGAPVERGESAEPGAERPVQVQRRAGRDFLAVSVDLPLGERDLEVLLLRQLMGREALVRNRNALAAGLGFVALPFVLLLLVELLTEVTKIRTRLSFLFLLTSAVPLTVMFLVLVNIVVSEQHRRERDVAEDLVEAARLRLTDLCDLTVRTAEEIADSLARAPGLFRPDRTPAEVRLLLQEAVRTFGGGDPGNLELRADVLPSGEEGRAARSYYSREHGEQSVAWGASEVGLSYHAGSVVFSAAAQRSMQDLELQVSVAGVSEAAVFQGLILDPGRGESLSLLSPLAREGDQVQRVGGVDLAGTRIGATVPLAEAMAVAEELRQGQGTLFRQVSGVGTRAYDLLTSQSGQPVAILSSSVESRPLQLDLGFARIDLLWFVLVLGALSLASSLFLGSVVTEGITRPLNRVRRGARALASGELGSVVPVAGADEVAQLAQSFNTMSEDLRHRISDQDLLARAAGLLTRTLDVRERVRVTMDFAQQVLGGRSVSCYLFDAAADRFELEGHRALDASLPSPPLAVEQPRGVLREVLAAGVPRWLEDPAECEAWKEGRADERHLLAAERSLLLVPLGRTGGPVGFLAIAGEGNRDPLIRIDETFLKNLISQVSVALENARLYRLAVEDSETGLYVMSHFESRLAEEVDRAANSGRELAVMRLLWCPADGAALEEGARLRLAQRTARELRRMCRDLELLAHAAALEFLVMVPEGGRDRVREIERELREELEPEAIGLRLRVRHALFPEDGASRDYLLDAVRSEGALGSESEEHEEPVLARIGRRFPDLSFRSARMAPVLRQIEKIAQSDASALLLGETGTGKEVAAQLLHRLSPRKDGPFVAVHCAALPGNLLESELFGHERGAFTGADRRRPGRFEEAKSGTVFLDEVAEIPLDVQVKLLRVIQERTVRRLGGTEEIAVDVHLLAATHRNLEQMVESGSFREDLYYRLKVVSLEMPPLRERLDEIPYLVESFLRALAPQGGREVRGIQPGALDLLRSHSWPGNIRELRNAIQRAVVLGTGSIIHKEDLEIGRGPHGAALEPAGEATRPQIADLNERQLQLLELLEAQGKVTSREYFERTGVSRRTALRDLTDLMDKGLILREGSRKAAVYRPRR